MDDLDEGRWLVFKLRGKKLMMGRGTGGEVIADFITGREHDYLVTREWQQVFLFPPEVWIEEGWKLRWRWRVRMRRAVFWEIPKGKDALMPSKWRRLEAPFEFSFAADIDGDGRDEVIGMDERRRVRLYWFRRTKSGELKWRDELLSRNSLWTWALIQDGDRRGLCVAWDDGTVELLTVR